MKYILMLMLTLSMVSCATHREPSSTDNQEEDVSRGINSDYFGPR